MFIPILVSSVLRYSSHQCDTYVVKDINCVDEYGSYTCMAVYYFMLYIIYFPDVRIHL